MNRKIHLPLLSSLMVLSCFFINGALAQEAVKTPESIEALQKRIDEIINQPRYAAAFWGVKIASLDSSKTIFEHNAEKLFAPASNSKLYTMALALDRLGPDYRIKTSLYAPSGPDENGVLKGDLVVYGRGDPTISGEYYDGDVFKALEPLVAALTNAGVKQISGDLIGDDSYFHGPPYGSGWSCDDLENEYGAEISALTINSNIAQLIIKPSDTIGAPAELTISPATSYFTVVNNLRTIGWGTMPSEFHVYRPVGENKVYVTGWITQNNPASSNRVTLHREDVTVHDPAAWFVALFKDALAQHGITVSGKTRSVHWTDHGGLEGAAPDYTQWKEIGSIQSRPFRDIIRSVQKPSQNLYTDLMLEHIGARANGSWTAMAEDSGVEELDKFLKGAGITRKDYYLEEGSGLSRDNLVSPEATVALLTYMSHQKDFKIYFDALPIAGVDGTLKRRMRGTAAAGNIHAKTGTLHWANSMSGYMTNAAGEHLVFSLMLNRFQDFEHDRSKTQDLDAIAEMLAGFKVRSGAK